jgi:ABC-type transporter Mla subunit MlaD
MTATEEIVGSLAPAVDDLDAAKTQAAAAASHAEDVRERVAAHGWEGIAAGMQDVIDQFENVQAAIGRAKDQADEAIGHVRQIDSKTNPAEVKEHLTSTGSKAGAAESAIGDAFNELDEAETTVSRVLDGGDPGQLLSMINEINQTLVSARQHVQNAKSNADAEIQEAAQAGN